MFKQIAEELRHHAPFTFLGALSGIIIMIALRNLSAAVSYKLFYTFHPFHVFLSALATAAMYRNYKCRTDRTKCNRFFFLVIGYVGSVGIATLSDSLVPYAGEVLLDMPQRQIHLGFIEKWWLINPLAIAGLSLAYFKPATKFPHYGHVLLSTWASLFHIMMALGQSFNWALYLIVFLFLFLAVWIPCCISDIVFPLLFVRREEGL